MDSKPKIAYVVSNYPAVAHTFILREVLGLRKLGWDVQTVSMEATPADAVMSSIDRDERRRTTALRPFDKLRAVRAWTTAVRHPRASRSLVIEALSDTHGTPSRIILQLRYVVEAIVLWNLMDARGIRHLHAHFANNANEASRLAVHFGNLLEPGTWKFTFTMHGPTGFFDVGQWSVARKVESADAVACITHFCKSQLLSIGPKVDWDKLRVAHLGTDVVPLREAPTNAVPKILCVGRVVDKKGQKVLVRAMATLRDRGIAATCTIIGDGPLRTELAQLVRELGLEDVVTLAGARHQEEVMEELRTADVFCMPSFSEGLPVAVMEAMSWQVPVITTNIAGVPELVTDGVEGLLVTPSDEGALVEALARLLGDPDLQQRLAAAGRARIEDYFNVNDAARRMEQFFEYCYR